MTAANGNGGGEGPIGGYTAEELVAALDASVGPENPRSDLSRRYDACEALQEYAENNAEMAQYFASILPNILMEEVDRLVGAGSAGELILVRGLSLDVQRTALSVLEAVTNPSIFEKPGAFEHPTIELAHPAVYVLAFAFSRETTQSSVSLLANLSKWRPEAVADHVASRFDLDQVCRALADHIQDIKPAPMSTENTNEAVRHATRLLAVLLVTHPDQVTDSDPVTAALEAVATSDLNRTQASVAVAADAFAAAHPTTEDDLESIRSFEAFVDETRATAGGRRMDTARAVGEGVAIERLGSGEETPVDVLLERMRNRDGGVRDAMAVALGEYRLLDASSLVDVRPQLRDQAANGETWSRLQRRARIALGAVAVATPGVFPRGVERYVDRLDASDSRPGQAVLRELGRVIETDAVADDGVLETLEASVRSADGDAKERAARGFAELLVEAPEHVPEVVRPLVAALERTSATIRGPLLETLAIATIAVPDAATDPRQPLVDFWQDPETSSTERAWAKRALGELAVVDRSLANDVTEPFAEHVFHGSLLGISNRTFNARILGEIIGSNPQAAAPAVDVYVEVATGTDDERRGWYALGALRDSVRALPALSRDAIASLVHLVKSLDRPVRVPAAAALGEAVTMVPSVLPDEFEPLREACVDADRSVRDRIAQALGEAVARDAATPAALRDAYRDVIPTLTGPNRWLATQELGELLAAVPATAPALCESLLEHARTVHRRHRLSITAAIGELATLATDGDADPLSLLESHVAGSADLPRRYRTRLLGEAVLAEAPDVPARANDVIDSIGRSELVPEQATFESAGSTLPGEADSVVEMTLVLEEFTMTPGEWRRATLLRSLGATVIGSFDANVARHLRATIYNEGANRPLEFHSILVEAGVLDAGSFLETVLEVGSGQAIGDIDIVRDGYADGLRRYLDSSDPGRREVLDAVARALEKRAGTAHATRIRRQIREFLADEVDVSPSTRLLAIDVLTATRNAAELD
jgi:hypothetical protein